MVDPKTGRVGPAGRHPLRHLRVRGPVGGSQAAGPGRRCRGGGRRHPRRRARGLRCHGPGHLPRTHADRLPEAATEKISLRTKAVDITAVGDRWVVYDPARDEVFAQGVGEPVNAGVSRRRARSRMPRCSSPGPPPTTWPSRAATGSPSSASTAEAHPGRGRDRRRGRRGGRAPHGVAAAAARAVPARRLGGPHQGVLQRQLRPRAARGSGHDRAPHQDRAARRGLAAYQPSARRPQRPRRRRGLGPRQQAGQDRRVGLAHPAAADREEQQEEGGEPHRRGVHGAASQGRAGQPQGASGADVEAARARQRHRLDRRDPGDRPGGRRPGRPRGRERQRCRRRAERGRLDPEGPLAPVLLVQVQGQQRHGAREVRGDVRVTLAAEQENTLRGCAPARPSWPTPRIPSTRGSCSRSR